MQTYFKFKTNVERFPPFFKKMFYVKHPFFVPFWEID